MKLKVQSDGLFWFLVDHQGPSCDYLNVAFVSLVIILEHSPAGPIEFREGWNVQRSLRGAVASFAIPIKGR